jgi:hypothetical protein
VNGLHPTSATCGKCGTVFSFPPPQTQSAPKAQWAPEDWEHLVNAAKPLLDEWIAFQKQQNDASATRLNIVSKHNRGLSASLIAFLLLVVGGMSLLTYYGKVDGEALLFLVGTVTGYVVLQIEDLTVPFFQEKLEEG